jgi:RNA recognition motif-containing protein
MLKMFVGNLPPEATQESVHDMFAAFGNVRSVEVAHDIFTGKCKGFGFVEMEGHEARTAQSSLNGNMMGGEQGLKVTFDNPRAKRGRGRR